MSIKNRMSTPAASERGAMLGGTKKRLLLAAGLAVLVASSSVLAEMEIKPYGAASYRYRGRIHTATTDDSSATTFDHINMVSWQVGLRAKVDDQLSLQFQIGNDWTAGESVSWAANNTPGGRVSTNNMYVHLAYARWNPGYLYMDVGVIPLSSNGTLDLLERSINTGSYNDAVYQGWPAQTNNSLMAAKVGVPILTDDLKLAAEVTVSVIDPRTQALAPATTQSPTDNPTSLLLMLNLPVTSGALKVTPEATVIFNRNYNSVIEEGDHEVLGGLSASYKVSDAVTVSFSGGYGQISNENSKVGSYNGTTRSGAVDSATAANTDAYYSSGMQFGAGTTIKAGPGTFAFDVKYGYSVDNATEATQIATKANNIYIDPRYTWNVHPRFTIMPRWRLYVTTFDKDNKAMNMRMENRPELVIGGSF